MKKGIQISIAIALALTVLSSARAGKYGPEAFDYPNGTTRLGAPVGRLVSTKGVAGIDDGALRLTVDGVRGDAAAFRLPHLDPERRLGSFTVRFDLKMFSRNRRPADGVALTFGRIPPGPGAPNRGFADAPGLNIVFDTFNNGEDPTSIEVHVNGRMVANSPTNFPTRLPRFQPVEIHWDAKGLDLKYAGRQHYQNQKTKGFSPESDYRFAFSAATGGSSQAAAIDNLGIDTELVTGVATGGPVLSELLPKNHTGIEDENLRRPDWIEVYNGSPDRVSLEGWALSLEGEGAGAWVFPAVEIKPFDYLLVFASGQDNSLPGSALHANFQLPDAGGGVRLAERSGRVVSRLSYPEVPEDVSFGWSKDPAAPGFLAKSTPAGINKGTPVDKGFLPPIEFSHESGLVTEMLSLEIRCPGLPRDAMIRYTLDGSPPTEDSPVYAGPLAIAKTTTVHAEVFAPGHLRRPPARRCFLFADPKLHAVDSNLPLIVLDTSGVRVDDDFSPNVKRKYRPTFGAAIELASDPRRARLLGAPQFAGFGAIRVRGHTSATLFPKKQYAWEIQDDRGDDRDASILGLPPESDWVLAAPYSDKTLMRNVLAFHCARKLFGQGGGSRTRFVELYLNQDGDDLEPSDYQGIYVLTEKIKRDENRIDIAKLNRYMVAPEKISGGYIFKKDKGLDWDVTIYTAIEGHRIGFTEPDDPNQAQRAALRDYLNRFEEALHSDQFAHPERGYAAYIDVRSFIDLHWLVEVFREIDGYQLSSYFTKDRGGKIRATPVWDYNLSLGNADFRSGTRTDVWQSDLTGGKSYPWWRRLFEDPAFERRYWKRYYELRASLFSKETLFGLIEQNAALVSEAQQRNFQRWPILGRYVWPNSPSYRQRKTYRSEVDAIKSWLDERLHWIDRQYLPPPVLNHAGGKLSKPLTLEMRLPGGVEGQIYYTTNGIDPGRREHLPNEPFLSSSTGEAEVWIPAGDRPTDRLAPEAWTKLTPPPNAAKWKKGTGAVGYETAPANYADLITHRVDEMFSQSTTCYIRIPFEIKDLKTLARFDRLFLRLRCDDGFIAYLNGKLIAQENAPPLHQPWLPASSSRSDDLAVRWMDYDITASRDLLNTGPNILAIHGFNREPGSSDALWVAQLTGLHALDPVPRPGINKYTQPINIQSPTKITAAIFDGFHWGAATEVEFTH